MSSPERPLAHVRVRFDRMEPLHAGKFALYAMRYTGKEWVGVADALSVDECMKAIQDDDWFQL